MENMTEHNESPVNATFPSTRREMIVEALNALGDNVSAKSVCDFIKNKYNETVSAGYFYSIRYLSNKQQKSQKSKLIKENLNYDIMRLGRKLIAETGGFDAAKNVLNILAVEAEKNKATLSRYRTILEEINTRLEGAMTKKERQLVMADKRKIEKLIETISEF